MKTCLILGVNGQDGSYIAEELITRGYRVYGVGRQAQSRWLVESPAFSYISLDLCDVDAYKKLLGEVCPDIICHFAAIHGSAGFVYENYWQDSLTINAIVTQATLEFQRLCKPHSYFYYLSSSKVFSAIDTDEINEETFRNGSCLYSIAKNLSTDLIHYYRDNHYLNASVLWTFNHESPRRDRSFFIPSIVGALADALGGERDRLIVNKLDFWCDWGSAQEYMNIIGDIVDSRCVSDMIIATGQPVFARDLIQRLFAAFQLDSSQYISAMVDVDVSEDHPVVADISHLIAQIGRRPKITIFEVCLDILKKKYSISV